MAGRFTRDLVASDEFYIDHRGESEGVCNRFTNEMEKFILAAVLRGRDTILLYRKEVRNCSSGEEKLGCS